MPEPKRRRKPCACACSGCAGTALLSLAACLWFLSRSGSYQPHIPPPPPLPVPNGYDDYVAAGQMLRANGGIDWVFTKGSAREGSIVPGLAAKASARNQAAIRRLPLAFGKECRAPLTRDPNQMFPDVAAIRDLPYLLEADASVRSARGDHAGALSDALAAIRLGFDIRKGGNSLHGLAGVRSEAVAQRIILAEIQRATPTEAAGVAARLQDLLLQRPDFRATLREDGYTALANVLQFDTFRAGLLESVRVDSPGWDAPPWGSARNAVGRGLWQRVRDDTLHEMEDYTRASLRETEKAASVRNAVAVPKGEQASIWSPMYPALVRRYESVDTRSRLLLIMLAIHAYQGQRGQAPTTLADLHLDQRLTQDPYAPRPLVYRPNGGNYLLYSVGPDLKDDGGVPMDDDADPLRGDLGVAPFSGKSSSRNYRRVPHMLPPKLPPGAPPLNP